MRIAIIAVLTSLAAGIFAAATLKLMMMVTALIWDRPLAQSWWYIIGACTLGGLLVGLTRIGNAHVESLGEQIEDAADPVHAKRVHVRLIALGAVVSVGFGGALGPEAGLIAVISQLAALVSMVVARSAAEARELGRASISGALAGLYASPPAGAVLAARATGADADDGAGGWAGAREAGIPYLGFLAALAGLGGFWLAANWLFSGAFHRIHLPAHVNPRDGSDMLFALLPAAFGAAAGAAFLHLQALVAAQAEARIASPVLQSALGGLLFGALAAAMPVLRFSGHHEFAPMLDWAAGVGAPALIGLALMKLLACAICLGTGWRGGAIFPLIFAGGAMGYAAHLVQSGPDAAVAIAAGLAGATAAGMGKPVAALLVVVFLVGGETLVPVATGIGAGMIAARFSPRPARH